MIQNGGKIQDGGQRPKNPIKSAQTCVFCDNGMKIGTPIVVFNLKEFRHRLTLSNSEQRQKFKMAVKRPNDFVTTNAHLKLETFIGHLNC